MAVRFILGRSGTGKSRFCADSMVESLAEPLDRCRLIFLVPEQATYQAEQAILSDPRIEGYHRLNVLSFNRLGFLLKRHTEAGPVLSATGREMIVRRILRQETMSLKLFGSSANQGGLAGRIADFIVELQQCNCDAKDVQSLCEELANKEGASISAVKYAELALIYAGYLDFLEGRFVNPDMQLTEVRRLAAGSQIIRGARVWIDGFSGFTGQELALLAEIFKVAEETNIALCLDPQRIDVSNCEIEGLDPLSLFAPTEKTYAQLLQIARKSRLIVREPVILNTVHRFAGCAELAHIERNIFAVEPTERIKPTGHVRVLAAADERMEVRFVARQIANLVRQDRYRYKDIAVVASDLGRYERYVEAYFGDYGIPFFIDSRKGLDQHPVVELVCSALRVLVNDFSHADLFCYLKTDLVRAERDEIDLLENYCIAYGLTGRDWRSGRQWAFAEEHDNFDEENINRIRHAAVKELLELESKFTAEGEKILPGELTRILFDFLDDLGVQQRLEQWIDQGGPVEARSHEEFFAQFVEIFDELSEIFENEPMSIEEYAAILESAFSRMSLAIIPPTLDQVLVGSIERSRHPELKAVFLIGAGQNQFPVVVSTEKIIGDEDRRAANEHGLGLCEGIEQQLSERLYMAYIAFSRASEKLYITYPLADAAGNAAIGSEYLDNLKDIFEGFAEETINTDVCEIDQVLCPAELADTLCERLGGETDASFDIGCAGELASLTQLLSKDEQSGALAQLVIDAAGYENKAQLDEEAGGLAFGKRLDCSVTQLQRFAACPYQHFAYHVLKLRKRKEFSLEPVDIGRFYHSVLQKLFEELDRKGKNIADTAQAELAAVLNDVIARLLIDDLFMANFVGHRKHNAFIISSAGEILQDCVFELAEMSRAGVFRPVAVEFKFSRYEIPLSGGKRVCLKGTIDRIDEARLDGRTTGVVFDYKRRFHKIDWAKLYHGLDIQLPVYILASLADRRTVGAFYIPVEITPPQAKAAEFGKTKEEFQRKGRGIFDGSYVGRLDLAESTGSNRFYGFYRKQSGEQYGNYKTRDAMKPRDFQAVLRHTESKIAELAETILAGVIDVRPYRLRKGSPCSQCLYKALCRFDRQINRYNLLSSPGKDEVLEKTTFSKAEVSDEVDG
ncbi:MAG: PD-(D/E)XK nuclease family protein [Planctomycetota bacterium]